MNFSHTAHCESFLDIIWRLFIVKIQAADTIKLQKIVCDFSRSEKCFYVNARAC